MFVHPFLLLFIRPLMILLSREALSESKDLSKDAWDSAALLASKVYYFLGEYDESLSFALRAGNAFEAESRAYGAEEYVETVVCEYHSANDCSETEIFVQLRLSTGTSS